jgi:hypothetical protein
MKALFLNHFDRPKVNQQLVFFCGYDPQEDIAKFGYKLNMKVKFLNMMLYIYIFGYST